MTPLNGSIIAAIALLAAFFILITVLKYAIHDTFARTRFVMTALFAFIVAMLTLSFASHVLMTLPFTIPALGLGMVLGYLIGVRTERQKLMMHGIEHYLEHFAHIEPHDLKRLNWWTFVNFYSVMCGLVLINLIGLTDVILDGSPTFVVISSTVGAALIGSIVPYLAHLWTVRLSPRSARS